MWSINIGDFYIFSIYFFGTLFSVCYGSSPPSSPEYIQLLHNLETYAPKVISTKDFNEVPNGINQLISEVHESQTRKALLIVGTAHEENAQFSFLHNNSLIEKIVQKKCLHLWSEIPNSNTFLKDRSNEIKQVGSYMDSCINNFINKKYYQAWEHPFYHNSVPSIIEALSSDHSQLPIVASKAKKNLNDLLNTGKIVGNNLKSVKEILEDFENVDVDSEKNASNLLKKFSTVIHESRFDFHPWLGDKLTSAINKAPYGTTFVLSIGNSHLSEELSNTEFELIKYVKPTSSILGIVWRKNGL